MSANFEPNQNEYKNLTPFKSWLMLQINTWGQNNFPFVESDFDELTNYGMLMKMMKTLNDVIANENLVEQDMTNLFNAFTELQNYVNDYFDNLDVQDEIDNKLDKLVEDGTLTELIGSYLNPYIYEQNVRINEVYNALSSVASGSPAGVYATLSDLSTADPDHSRIYVVSANGHWYYYNGTQWSDGGVYQTSVDGDEVAFLKRNMKSDNEVLKEQVNINLNAFDGDYSHDFYSASTGETSSTNPKYISNVNIIEIPDVTTFDYKLKPISNTLVGMYFLFYNNDTFLSYIQKGVGAMEGNITIPANANKLRFEIQYTNDLDIADSTNMIITFPTEESTRTKLYNNEIDINKIKAVQKNLIEKESITLSNGCYNRNLVVTDLTQYGYPNAKHGELEVVAGEKIHIQSFSSYYYPIYAVVDENDSKIADYYTMSGDTNQNARPIDYTFIVPENGVKILISTLNSTYLFNVEKISYKNVGVSNLPKLKYIAFGDSVSRGNHPDASKSPYAWPELFGQIHNLDTTNLSHGGQGYLSTQYYAKTAFETIQETDISDANLITLSFGMNDSSLYTYIGTIDDTGTDTILGNVYNCINYIQTQNNKCQIIVVGTTKANGYFGNLSIINNGIKALCEKYGIAFIDTSDQPFNQWNGTSSGSLTTDGIHFNDDGYILLAQYMCGKLGSLYGLE